jgi:hypothetical protein
MFKKSGMKHQNNAEEKTIMKSYYWIAVAFSAGIILITCAGNCTAQGQEWSFREIANRLSQEKQRVVSYRLFMRLQPESGSRFANCSWIEEYSSSDDHHVIAKINFDDKNLVKDWSLRGRTGNNVLGGSSQTNEIFFEKFDANNPASLPKTIDWRILGGSLCGDLGDPFDVVIKNIANWSDFGDAASKFEPTKDGVRAEFGGDTSMDIQILGGTRITRLVFGKEIGWDEKTTDHGYTEWSVDYKKRDDLRLPIRAALRCGNDRATFTLDWQMVNDPIEVGKKTISRFIESLPNAKFRQ